MGGNQLAELYRPQTWDQFVGNEELIKSLRKDIELNIGVSYFVEGSSGSGKTTLVNIWTKTLLCRNREPGTSEACGVCPVCTGEDTLNIHSATIEDATKAKDIINGFIDDSFTPPRPIESKSGVMRQVFILNELQNASNAAHSMLLKAIEEAPISTTWILVTMSPERFNITTLEALRARCKQVLLVRKNEGDVATRLKKCLPDLEEPTCMAVAFFSNGNIREAWSILGLLHPLHEIKDITSQHVYNLKAGGCTNEERKELWDSIAKGDTSRVSNLIDSWISNSTEEIIASLLMWDLRRSLKVNDYNSLLKLKHLQQWYRLSIKYPLSLCLMGMSCESFHTKLPITSLKEELPRLVNEEIKPVDETLDTKEEIPMSNTSQLIFEQLKQKVDPSLDMLKFKKQVNGLETKDVLKEANTFRQLRMYFDGN